MLLMEYRKAPHPEEACIARRLEGRVAVDPAESCGLGGSRLGVTPAQNLGHFGKDGDRDFGL
jgi:hypothetical protein